MDGEGVRRQDTIKYGLLKHGGVTYFIRKVQNLENTVVYYGYDRFPVNMRSKDSFNLRDFPSSIRWLRISIWRLHKTLCRKHNEMKVMWFFVKNINGRWNYVSSDHAQGAHGIFSYGKERKLFNPAEIVIENRQRGATTQ